MSLILIGITAYFLIFGALYGLKRGILGSAIRLFTVCVAFAVAWYARAKYVAAVLDIQIDGQSVRSLIEEATAEMASIGTLLMPLVEILLGVILFIAVFLILKLVTAIIYFIIGFFVPKSNRWLGLAVGLVQGALIAFCICAPLNGVLLDVAKVTEIQVNGEPVLDAETRADMKEAGVDFEEFKESGISKFYAKMGSKFYDMLAASKNVDGNNVTLSGYVDAAVATTKFAEELTNLSNINFEEGLTEANRESLKQTFENLDAIKGEMSEEAITTVNQMISSVVTEAGGEMPEEVKTILEDFDMSKVDFSKEGDVVIKLYDIAEEGESAEGEIDVVEVVNTLAESTVILPIMESMVTSEQPLELPDEETKTEVSNAIEDIAKTNPEAAESLKKIFGLN